MPDHIGIDYSGGSGANTDPATGIRYGVISQGSVMPAWGDFAEPDYGDPTCPKCGKVAKPFGERQEHRDTYESDGSDYVCEDCKYTFESSEAYSDEPLAWSYTEEGYRLVDCLTSDIMVIKSPYFTYAQFCSPCVPGAGNLDHPMVGGVKCYCLGHDWFEDDKAPYPVYRVSDGVQVQGIVGDDYSNKQEIV